MRGRTSDRCRRPVRIPSSDETSARRRRFAVRCADPDRKAQVVNNHGEARYVQMIADLEDNNKINLTHKTILPAFLTMAIEQFKENLEEV